MISLNQLISEIHSCTENEYIISEAAIIPDEKDVVFLEDKIFYTPYVLKSFDSGGKSIYFYDCKFEFPEDAPLEFKGWVLNKCNFVNCFFDVRLSFEDCSLNENYPLKMYNCTFTDELYFSGEATEIKKLEFDNCNFFKTITIDFNPESVVFNNSVFLADTNKFAEVDEEHTFYQFNFFGRQVQELNLSYCRFSSNNFSNLFSVNLRSTEIEKLIIINVRLETIDLTDATVTKSLLIDSLNVSGYIGVRNFDFPEENTNIPWYNLKGEKFCIFIIENNAVHHVYQAKTYNNLANEILYNDLISAYNKFNTMYHTRGDIRSANGSYVEIKDIETRKQKYLYETNPSFNIYLNYKLNVFLKFFSDYATNPARSLIVSLWVIILFGLVYIFTFSNWDGINFSYFVKQYKKLATYFMSEKSLKELFFAECEKEMPDYKSFRSKYLNHKNKLPLIIRILGFPIYECWSLKYSLTAFVYEKFEILNGSWGELNTKRKMIISLIVILLIIFYLLYIVIIKCINAFILSLNMFITIGFGVIPEKGLAMYIGVIEGFIGWFLLTIFTITLLSQVLQSAG